MAKAKQSTKRKPEDKADVISELLELAEKLHLADGMFDGDVDDETHGEARLKADSINEQGLMSQLEYLYDRGYQSGRLAELIREYALGS